MFSHSVLVVKADDGSEYVISGHNEGGVLKLETLDRGSTDKEVQHKIAEELKGTHVVFSMTGSGLASATRTLRTATMTPIKYHAFGINSNSVIHTLDIGAGILGTPRPSGAVGWNRIAPIQFAEE